MKGPDSQSKRSKRRAKRGMKPTKYQRRAEAGLAARMAEYTAHPANRESQHKFTKPGSLKRKSN